MTLSSHYLTALDQQQWQVEEELMWMPPILHPGIDCHLDISVLGTVELEAQVIYRKKKKKKKKAVRILYKGVSSTWLLSGQEESTVKFWVILVFFYSVPPKELKVEWIP